MNAVVRRTERELAVAVAEELDRRSVELVSMLPREVSLEEFKRVTLNALQGNPELLGCTFKSLFGAITRAAREGWVPDGRECYFDVRKNTKTGELTCAFIPGVHGYLKNTVGITLDDWRGGVVREGDDYEVVFGDNEHFTLRVDPFTQDEDRPIIGAYSIAILPGGKISRQFMSMKKLMAAKAKSASANGPRPQYSPWNTHPEDMYIKTVMKKHANRLPVGKRAGELLAEEREYDAAVTRGEAVDADKPKAAPKPRVAAPAPTAPAAQLQHLANGHDAEEEKRPPAETPAPAAAAPPAHTDTPQSSQPSTAAQTGTVKTASPSDAKAPAPASRQAQARRGPGRPTREEAEARARAEREAEDAAEEARKAAEAAAADDGQTEIGGGNDGGEIASIDQANIDGYQARNGGIPRSKAPAHYKAPGAFELLSAWLDGWDEADEEAKSDAAAGRVMA